MLSNGEGQKLPLGGQNCYFAPGTPRPDLNTNCVPCSASREKNDLGFLTFDLNADLTPLFNWNVKQLFLYLTAEYETPKNKVNQVVLWDKIIQRGENAVLDYRSMNTKYYFWDDGNGLL